MANDEEKIVDIIYDDENNQQTFHNYDSRTEHSWDEISRQNFKMIFMNSSYSEPNVSNDFRTNLTAAAALSCQTSCRTPHMTRYTASLKKAISSMKLHSYKTQFLKSTSTIQEANENNNMLERIDSKQVPWYHEFDCISSIFNSNDIFLHNKLMVQLRCGDSADDIFLLMKRGVSLFTYELSYGTVDDHVTLWSDVGKAAEFASQIKDITIASPIVPEISHRNPMTGKLKRGIHKVVLKPGMKVIVTADRTYARMCQKRVIYINCRHTILLFKPMDTIQIEDVVLRVRKSVKISHECDVLMGGIIKSRMPVVLPATGCSDLSRVSCEELEDIVFITYHNIDCMMLPNPGDSEYYLSIRNAIELLGNDRVRLIVRVREDEIKDYDHADWIAKTYDGVLFMCASCPCAQRSLSDLTKHFIEQCHQQMKSITLQCLFEDECCHSNNNNNSNNNQKCVKTDYEFLCSHIDCFYVPNYELAEKSNLLGHCMEPDMTRRLEQLNNDMITEPYADKSSTGSNTMARVISKITYDLAVKSIIICSSSGRMPTKIARFRPKCPIIVLTKNQAVLPYLKTFFNIYLAPYQDNSSAGLEKLERRSILIARLLHGLVYGLSLQIFGHGDVILFCYKSPPDFAYTNCTVPFRLDVNMMKRQIEGLNAETDGEPIIK